MEEGHVHLRNNDLILMKLNWTVTITKWFVIKRKSDEQYISNTCPENRYYIDSYIPKSESEKRYNSFFTYIHSEKPYPTIK